MKCPIRAYKLNIHTEQNCLESKCAWWVEGKKMCGLLLIALSIKGSK